MTAHAVLRAATRAAHDQVDSAFSRWNLGKREDYAAFLLAHARAFLPVEAALIASGTPIDQPRADLLVGDLAELGLAPPPFRPVEFANSDELLGGAYVLEGSRLGGAVLRKSVAPDLPTRFLAPPPRPGHWQAFLHRLEHSLISDVQRSQAVVGAHKVFDRFLRAALAPTG